MIREVLDPQWSPMPAARAVVEHVGGDPAPLRAARVHVLASMLDRATRTQTRALATINDAILQIEARSRTARGRSARAI